MSTLTKKASEHDSEIPQSRTTHCRRNQGTFRKSRRTITITRHQGDKQSKATSSQFPIKIITNQKRALRNAQENMEQTHNDFV